MEDRRMHSRLKFEIECHLKGIANDSYKVLLIDLSFSGALTCVEGITPFRSGDLCQLVLSDKQSDFPITHNSEVVWVESGRIGLNFLN